MELASGDEEVMLSAAALRRRMWLQGRLSGEEQLQSFRDVLGWEDETGF